ncbi:hypothetical protein D3C77_482020 [compost metagenome]
MSRIPIPSDSEKKACPSATNADSGVSWEKSGLRKKDTPASAPGSVTARIIKTISRMTRLGISILLNFSIPPDIPRITTPPVMTRATNCQKIGI